MKGIPRIHRKYLEVLQFLEKKAFLSQRIFGPCGRSLSIFIIIIAFSLSRIR